MDYRIGIATNLQKIFRDKPFEGQIGQTVHISAARNEYEGFQVVIVPGRKDVTGVRVEPGDLVNNEKGCKIDKENIEACVVGYVFADEENGWWPDPLLRQESFDVAKGRVQPLWITVYVPESARAGDYEGIITLRPSNSNPAKVRLSLKVWDFNLPREQNLKTFICVRPNQLSQFYFATQDYRQVLTVAEYRQYLDMLLSHRITPAMYDESDPLPGNYDYHPMLAYIEQAKKPDGTYSFDFSRVEQNLRYCFDRGASMIPIGQVPGGSNQASLWQEAPYRGYLRQYLSAAARFLREKGWLHKAYLYSLDEPRVEHSQSVVEVYNLAKQICPDLRVFVATGTVSKDLMGVVEKGADIWCPSLIAATERGGLTMADCVEMQRKGKELWWYANYRFYIPLSAMDHRMVFWLTWKYDLSGFAYWGTAFWWPNTKDNVDEIGSKESWNTHPVAGDWRGAAGDGHLVYPSLIRKPLSSIRLEVFRDGIEDWEYLYLLRQRIQEIKNKKVSERERLVSEGESLLKIEPDLAADVSNYTTDPERIHIRRREIADLIEEMGRLL